MARIGFLNGRSDQTGVKRDLARKERNAKIDVAEDTITRIGQRTVRRVAKQRRRHGAKALDRGNPERFLAVEVMKEAALGDAGRRANVVDRAAGIALGSYDVAGRIEQLAAFSASQARGSGALAREEVAWPVNTEGDPGVAAPAGAAQELCVCRRFASESFSFALSFVTPGHSRSWNGVVSLANARHPCRTYACTAHSTG